LKKSEITVLIITALFVTFTLGYFVGRTGAAGTIAVSREADAVAVESADKPPSAAPSEPAEFAETPPPPPVPEPIALPTIALDATSAGDAATAPPVITPEPTATPAPTPEPHYIDGKLRINFATQAEFETLPGIGPTLAARIVAYRDSHGPFKKLTTLKSVEGIGDGRYDAIKDQITVE
jgi:competence ComEA-like helix-hairpin-helix protein